MVDERDKVVVGDLVFVILFDGTFKKWVGEAQSDRYGLYIDVNGEKEYLEEVDEVRRIKSKDEALQLMQPHHCSNCEYAKKITFAPNLLIAVAVGQIAFRPPKGPRDGVLCASEEMTKGLGALEEFKKQGYVHLWRVEVVEGETAECDHWKQIDIDPRLKGIIDSI